MLSLRAMARIGEGRSSMVTLTDEQYREAARNVYGSDDVEFDQGVRLPKVSRARDESGAWIAAWVWIDAESDEIDEVEG